MWTELGADEVTKFETIDRALADAMCDANILQILTAYEPLVIPRLLWQTNRQLEELTQTLKEIKDLVAATHVNTT